MTQDESSGAQKEKKKDNLKELHKLKLDFPRLKKISRDGFIGPKGFLS